MKVLLDVNIVLDVLLDREPHAQASAQVWAAIETRKAEGLLAAHAVTTIHYLIRRDAGDPTKAKGIVASLLAVFAIAPVNQAVVRRALELPGGDFEDAVTAAAAEHSRCGLIVTRDPKGFRGSAVSAVTPETAMAVLNTK